MDTSRSPDSRFSVEVSSYKLILGLTGAWSVSDKASAAMIASFDSNPVGYDEGGTERASGKKRVARDNSALMKIWQRASSVGQRGF